VREVEVSAVPLLDTKGAVTGAALTIDDVTERGRRERAERDFVSNAAHQLRSPLTAMTGAVAVLRSSPNLDEATRTRFLDHIERETDRMVRLTHGLLTLARVERDEVRPRPTVVPVRPLLAGLAEDASGAVISVEADDEAAVVANEELLVEALTNLVGNAVRHGGGRVALRGLRVDGDVVLEVADSGPGMTPEVLERVFDRFYRAEGVRTGGFGLGLPIARAAARAAGGDLTLESAAGAGTTARIRLMGAKLL
jgi:signal transduction histidine kinase